MPANHELFSLDLGVTSSNKKTNPSDELKVENSSKETDYIMAIEIFVAFGKVDRIKKVWQDHNKTNTFYFCFANAESVAIPQSKTNNMYVLGHKLISSIQDEENYLRF